LNIYKVSTFLLFYSESKKNPNKREDNKRRMFFFDDWSFIFFYARIKEEEEVKLGNKKFQKIKKRFHLQYLLAISLFITRFRNLVKLEKLKITF
jgi:hypothetical protein